VDLIKPGILHDYDLMANAESSAARQKCVACDEEPMVFQWSDCSGEAMCTRCGCPYQLKWGGKEKEAEGKYPYLVLRDELVEPLRAYYKETNRFTCLGVMLGSRPGLEEFWAWVETNRPELIRRLKLQENGDGKRLEA